MKLIFLLLLIGLFIPKVIASFKQQKWHDFALYILYGILLLIIAIAINGADNIVNLITYISFYIAIFILFITHQLNEEEDS